MITVRPFNNYSIWREFIRRHLTSTQRMAINTYMLGNRDELLKDMDPKVAIAILCMPEALWIS